jgi:hypothetical protein
LDNLRDEQIRAIKMSILADGTWHAKPWWIASAKAVIAIRIADTPGGLAADRRRVGIAI